MTSSREQPKTTEKSVLLDDGSDFLQMEVDDKDESPTILQHLPPLPPNFPKRSRSLRLFTYTSHKTKKETCHLVNTATRNGKDYFVKDDTPEEKTAENLQLAEILAQLEVTSCEWYRLVEPDIVPATHACYEYKDDAYYFTAVSSKKLPGFTPNRYDPLLEQDLIIEPVENDTDYQRHRLMENLKLLSASWDRTPNDSSWLSLSYAYSYTRNQINWYSSLWDSKPKAIQLKDHVDKLLTQQSKLSRETLNTLLNQIEARQQHISKMDTTPQRQTELEYLKIANETTKKLMASTLNEHVDVKKLEEIDKLVKKLEDEIERKYAKEDKDKDVTVNLLGQSITIKVADIKNGGLLGKLDKNRIINEKAFNKPYPIKVRDLINYRTIKGLAKGTIASYVNAENDYHNRNGAKNGKRVDTDMSEWGFMQQFKKTNFSEWLFSKTPNFNFTERDIRNFPNLQDAVFRYFPTKNSFSQSKIDLSSLHENFYTQHDNEVFQKLAFHPVYVFHKFKSLLKHILTTEAMYRSIAQMNIRNDLNYVDEKDTKREEYDFVLMSAKAINLNDLRIISEKNSNKPILIRHGDQVSLYGFSGQTWKTTELDRKLFEGVKFPEENSTSVLQSREVTKEIRQEVTAKKGHIQTKNLLDEFVKYKAARIQQLKDVLLRMPEFRDFLAENGDYVFKEIQQEFADYKQRCERKVQQGKIHYQPLVDAIDLAAISKEYKKIVRLNIVLSNPMNKNIPETELEKLITDEPAKTAQTVLRHVRHGSEGSRGIFSTTPGTGAKTIPSVNPLSNSLPEKEIAKLNVGKV
ncbi:hypothetical protein [Aquicella lusitana]|uniref:Uncharacterized protein n=1 Tax=Aquicella lusitana TaxID=254246 RepID=A0A370GN79_9COXI|nr:hypothetical protein [Aquicella lusitana]RDI45178.1 hypothetical protein C8D86_10757 [Aquicella lusitana]VVC72752.1 hypothetical protein AQULUS_04730 [Aquicella lusitana]